MVVWWRGIAEPAKREPHAAQRRHKQKAPQAQRRANGLNVPGQGEALGLVHSAHAAYHEQNFERVANYVIRPFLRLARG